MLKSVSGDKEFQRLTRWNVLDYTYISRKSTFAPYADNYGSNDAKLCLTRFRFNNNWEPFSKYKPITPIKLDDLSLISMKADDGYYLEINSDKTKVRVYKEIT